MTRHLTTLTAPANLTMSTKEIAELLDARHDNVKRTVDRMADRGVIEFPPSEEIPTATRPVEVYHLDKRSSLIVVAQLSPEFTARVVDRWQELEARVAAPALPNFGNPAEAARAWALQFERAEQQAQKVIEVSQELARSEVIASKVMERNETLLGFVRHNLHGVSQMAIQKWLKAEGYLLRREGHWEPRATAKELFEARYTKIHDHTHSTIYPTEKGKRLLARLYCEGRLPITVAAQKKRRPL